MFLDDLTNLNGVSGMEDDVRKFILDKVKPLADEVNIDGLGNIIAKKNGKNSKLKVMLSAHMDEVGFIVNGYLDKGSISFRAIGGIDSRILPGKKVLIGDKKIPGVIGVKPIHMQNLSEQNKIIPIESLYIDIGVDSKEEAKKFVELGEYISFSSDYIEFGSGLIKAKALDDRVGCFVLLEVLKSQYDFDIYCCFTVQEEVGLRGSETATYQVSPDIALIVEGTTCSDLTNILPHEQSTKLGEGPAITILDRTAYSDKNFVNLILETAKKYNIKAQIKQTVSGGNDAGKIQRSKTGTKVAVISVPCRYIHTPVSVMSKSDFENTIKLVDAVLKETSNLEVLG